MFEIRQILYSTLSPENVTWEQACLKVPLVPSEYSDFVADSKSTEYEDEDDYFSSFSDDEFEPMKTDNVDLSVQFYPEPYCSVFNSLDSVCFEDNILELFASRGSLTKEMIQSLSQESIMSTINDMNNQKSGIFSVPKNFLQYLGEIEYDQDGQIMKAKAARMDLFGKMNVTKAHLEAVSRDSFLGDQLALEQIDEKTRSIEDQFISLLFEQRQNMSESNSSRLKMDFIIAKSFPDAVNERITGDLPKVLGSFVLMFVYVTVALGKLNCIDNKSLLGLSGLFSVLMALLTSYGLCCICGLFISPLHNFIPFLLLGLGVDDMFVIVQAFNLLDPIKDKQEIPGKIAKALSNSGVAISITSLTDLLAFAVGATTTVPALESFCIYCGLGIFAVYIYQITWFTAWLVIDQRRMLANRNACLPCIKTNSTNENKSNTGCGNGLPNCLQFPILEYFSSFLTRIPVKIIVILLTVVIFVASIYGNVLITEEFDPWLFLDPNSYVATFKRTQDKYFPQKGESVLLFFSGDVTKHNLQSLDNLLSSITEKASHLILNVNSWFLGFQSYFTENLGHPEGMFSSEIDEIRSSLTQFLYSPRGGRYQYLFTVKGALQCGVPSPEVYVSIMELTHRHFNTSIEGIEAMNTIKQLMRSSTFEG